MELLELLELFLEAHLLSFVVLSHLINHLRGSHGGDNRLTVSHVFVDDTNLILYIVFTVSDARFLLIIQLVDVDHDLLYLLIEQCFILSLLRLLHILHLNTGNSLTDSFLALYDPP